LQANSSSRKRWIDISVNQQMNKHDWLEITVTSARVRRVRTNQENPAPFLIGLQHSFQFEGSAVMLPPILLWSWFDLKKQSKEPKGEKTEKE